MNIKQIRTSSCQTIYDVDGHRLRLWIIVGGTPALAFEDYKGGTKRFTPTDEVRQKWSRWSGGLYPHQHRDNVQGPTFEEVLPGGLDDVRDFVAEHLPKRERAIAVAKEHRQFREWGLPVDRERWSVREAEPKPRVLYAPRRDDGGYIVQGSKVVKSLKKAGRILNLNGCIFATAILRQYCRIWRNETLIIYPPNGEQVVKLVVPDGRNRATIKHGARDKYHGLNGYNAELLLKEETYGYS